MDKLDNFINKIGVDKLLHFSFGANISFIISNLIIFNIDNTNFNNLWSSVIGIIITMIIEFIKEYLLDNYPDKKDILATFIGSIIPFIVNIISILFYISLN